MCRDVFAILPTALRLNQDLKAQQLHNCKSPTTAQFKIARDSNKPQKPLLEHLFQFLFRKSKPRRNSGRSKRNNIMIIRVQLPQQFFKSPFTLCFLCLNPRCSPDGLDDEKIEAGYIPLPAACARVTCFRCLKPVLCLCHCVGPLSHIWQSGQYTAQPRSSR